MSKMDGLVNLQNVLVVGMTNRKELLDEALLRPGRMEVSEPTTSIVRLCFSNRSRMEAVPLAIAITRAFLRPPSSCRWGSHFCSPRRNPCRMRCSYGTRCVAYWIQLVGLVPTLTFCLSSPFHVNFHGRLPQSPLRIPRGATRPLFFVSRCAPLNDK